VRLVLQHDNLRDRCNYGVTGKYCMALPYSKQTNVVQVRLIPGHESQVRAVTQTGLTIESQTARAYIKLGLGSFTFLNTSEW
jgi:hypothetical protein